MNILIFTQISTDCVVYYSQMNIINPNDENKKYFLLAYVSNSYDDD